MHILFLHHSDAYLDSILRSGITDTANNVWNV